MRIILNRRSVGLRLGRLTMAYRRDTGLLVLNWRRRGYDRRWWWRPSLTSWSPTRRDFIRREGALPWPQ